MKKYYAKKELTSTPQEELIYHRYYHFLKGDEVNVVGEENSTYMVDVDGQKIFLSKDSIEVLEVAETFNFGQALEILKQGKKVARKGWNGKGQFVVYQKGYPNGIPCNKQTAEAWGMKEGDLFRCEPYLQIRTADGSHAMWSPSTSDCRAEDWEVVE